MGKKKIGESNDKQMSKNTHITGIIEMDLWSDIHPKLTLTAGLKEDLAKTFILPHINFLSFRCEYRTIVLCLNYTGTNQYF